MIEWQNFFDQPVEKHLRTYTVIRKIAVAQGDDYTTSCLLDYAYFKEHNMIAINLNKQHAFDADLKAILEI